MGTTTAIVGRSQQIARLAALVAGDPRALVVEGDAGVGKTALLDELEGLARGGGWSVTRYDCPEAERRFPYAALDRVLRPLDRYVSGLADHHRTAVDTVLGRTTGDAPSVMVLGPAVLNLFVLAAGDGLHLGIVDDAHFDP